jgi:hypothetical protein
LETIESNIEIIQNKEKVRGLTSKTTLFNG